MADRNRMLFVRACSSWLFLSIWLLAGPAQGAGFGWQGCQTAVPGWRSNESIDLYNALAWAGAAGGLAFGANPSERSGVETGVDRDIRNGLRLSSVSARRDADLASDILLSLSVGIPILGVAKTAWEGDCAQAYAMFGQTAESLTLVNFLTILTKNLVGNERPFGGECDTAPPSDAECDSRDRFRSFFSGHAATAAAGAGLACSFALKRGTWGHSRAARAGPCLLGSSFALATGLLRIASDRHWGTDVAVGFAVGAVVGVLDTYGPFDLLRIGREDGTGVQGVITPYAAGGNEMGLRVQLVY